MLVAILTGRLQKMKKINILFYLNFLALILSILWMISYPDFEPAISTIGLTISMFNFKEYKERPIILIPFFKHRNLIVVLFLILSLLAFIFFNINGKRIIGIEGNNNNQNKIIISK